MTDTQALVNIKITSINIITTIPQTIYPTKEIEPNINCYNSCQNCEKPGDVNNHNCLKCKDGFYLYKNFNNCFTECPSPSKTFEDSKECLEECFSEQFEYNNACYTDCPENKQRIFITRNMCIDAIPEGYYLDENDRIYKKCYDTCKNCNKPGNDETNNCNEYKNNYIFFDDYSAKKNNCYEIFDKKYYYFDENKQYK